MSRSVPLLGSLCLLFSAVVVAQEPPSVTAEEALEDARNAYGPPAPEPDCTPQEGDEIVVCAQEEDQEQYRVKSSSELDPESEEALDDGLPRAPDVAGPGIFKGPPTVGGLCIPGLQKCPPPPALIIDFSELPEAPPGSDADRMARGLPPVGNDEGTGEAAPEEPTGPTPQ